MSYQVHTEVFEGPLDLLLQLITSHQVEITELSLSDLVAEYLSHLDAMRELDLEVTSEFLLIAATLVQLKARRLLPGDPGVDLDEELALAEERDRLLSRLLACLTFKDVAAVLAHRFETGSRSLPRAAGLDPEIAPAPPELRLTTTPGELAGLLVKLLRRSQREPDLDHIDLELPSVGDALADLRRRIAEAVETDFDRVTAHCERSLDVAAYFLALLELARWGIVAIGQEHRDAPIAIRHRSDDEPGEVTSEWVL
jgi:segregation and condensation protein A